MNTELIIALQNKIEELSSTVGIMEKTVNALKINDQRRLDSNIPIPPGIACKVAYDKNGLITKGIGLEVSDIPQLDIDKIINLKKHLDDKASLKDFEKFKSIITEMIQPTVKNLGYIVGTATKVNFNQDGRIVATSDLLPSDIPMLPISKIEGLADIISNFNIQMISENNENSIPNIKVSPGTYAKVTIDQYGRVITGDKLGMNDIPSELISKLNIIESRFADIPSQQTIIAIQKSLVDKLDANKSIIPGTFTKVKVDSKGLVTFGEKLSIRDLPELGMSDINGLEKAIREKADQKDILSLSDTVSSLVNSLSSIGEISGIKNELKTKAKDEDVRKLSSNITQLKNTLDSFINRIPSDMILEQLTQIQNEVSSLSGRVSAIEKHLDIGNHFS